MKLRNENGKLTGLTLALILIVILILKVLFN